MVHNSIENFGSGTTYGLSACWYYQLYFCQFWISQDGQYTIYNRTNFQINAIHDRTPDNEPDGINGKCLIVNASNLQDNFERRSSDHDRSRSTSIDHRINQVVNHSDHLFIPFDHSPFHSMFFLSSFLNIPFHSIPSSIPFLRYSSVPLDPTILY